MKKLLMLLCALTLVFGMLGNASAMSFTDTVSLSGVILGEGPIAAALGAPIAHSYSHATPPPDVFSVPPDILTSATLTVSGYYIDGGVDGGDAVAVSGSVVGTLTPGGTKWSGPSTSMFDISPSFSTWSGGLLGITITAAGGFLDGIIKLSSSTLALEWVDGDGAAPVPEPATILLMGIGLLGLVAYSRKRFNKKG